MRRWIALQAVPPLVLASLFPALAGAQGNPSLNGHMRALYAGDFAKAREILALVRGANADPAFRFDLLMRRIRVAQVARLSGRPDAGESAALAALQAEAPAMRPAKQAEARFVSLVSTYFRRLTQQEAGDFMSLQADFDSAADQITDPCIKADAFFFSALMMQMSGKVLESEAGLERARSAAAAAGCELERSYALRHLAVVAEEQGDLEKAARLAQESIALRRRVKFEVFLPYSLLHSADLAQKQGDIKGAKLMRQEALHIAHRLKLPSQTGAARAALGLEK
jgi:tetratricopeptide (TPR) repeat protein